MGVGDLIRLNREKRGISQSELARRLGITRSFMSKLEKEQRTISSDTLIKISDILNCPIEDLYPNDTKRNIEINKENILILDRDKYNLQNYTEEQILEFIKIGQKELEDN